MPRDVESLRPALRLGWHLLVSGIAWYAYSNADFTVVGRVLGTSALGAYTLAWTIASVPVDRISSLVGRVTPAFFSAVQTDPTSLRRYLSLLTEGLAFVTLPLCLGLFLTAHDFVTAFLGPQWTAVTVPLQLLALYAALRSVALFAPQVLVSTGRSKRSMMFSVLALIVLPPVFYFGTRWGTAGVAMGWVTVYPVLVLASFVRYALRAIEMRWSTYLASLVPAATAAAAMMVAVWLTRAATPLAWGVRPRFAIEVAAGVIAYCGLAWGAHRGRITGLVALLKTGGSAPQGEAAKRLESEGQGVRPPEDILMVTGPVPQEIPNDFLPAPVITLEVQRLGALGEAQVQMVHIAPEPPAPDAARIAGHRAEAAAERTRQ
jgi:O-antigen/teichoic acid export membrane protein